ncbi:hypothetical protein BIW11_00707 [Tropilaelaps mercedesae]|uniref:Cuticle protein 10.9-like n=1 Tax=Tropilaelaps mercedesae TaxID=418985 RepID=A0A1V9XQP6_9ACAR|nr:hypothetical protein BIW11_00707 [Tropilaelaps mercedesae]
MFCIADLSYLSGHCRRRRLRRSRRDLTYGFTAPALAALVARGYSTPLGCSYAALLAHRYAALLAYAAAAPAAKIAAAPVVATAAIGFAPQPYQFGYESVDEHGTKQVRHEVSDAYNNKKGSYSFTDARGIARRVDYVADAAGFRATVHTNEPGTAPSTPAAALYNTAPLAVKAVAALLAVRAAAAAPISTYVHAPVATNAKAPVTAY